ncbi:MAG: hypothetical protein BWY75_02211 [bacterium ADurb.Bin425]|nr:MAG: hypothetical protein BWY75_02211 [bacterium ADurb.Bin425]
MLGVVATEAVLDAHELAAGTGVELALHSAPFLGLHREIKMTGACASVTVASRRHPSTIEGGVAVSVRFLWIELSGSLFLLGVGESR